MRTSVDVRGCQVAALIRACVVTLAVLLASTAHAQERIEREGLVLYWGLVPAAVVSQQHALEELPGGRPPGGGKVNHLVIALFDAASGRRIDTAVVRAQLTEPGITDAPAKYLPPMTVNGQASYGQLFGMVGEGPFRFRVFVKLSSRDGEIEYNIAAAPQLGSRRR